MTDGGILPTDRTSDAGPDDAQQQERTVEEPYYCPGCGARYEYRQQCSGADRASPHAPIEVVSTDELQGLDLPDNPQKDTAEQATRRENLTAAPNTDRVG